MASSFRFRQFEVRNESSALKVGTDAVLLGASMTIQPADSRLLDIGTGTGVIALMAAQRSKTAVVTAIDIDKPSAEEAAFNFAHSPWPDRLESIHTSLAQYSPSAGFDLIFSNPPFYDNSLKNPDSRESAARHTETLSYREICGFASAYLTQDGRLSLILPAEEEIRLCRTAASFGLHPFRIVRVRTTERKPFRRMIAEFGRERTDMCEEELVLQRGDGRSEAYEALTSEFYI